ncbi:hypothetical protein L7F22_035153 [Adiantum nelumboides]|nr:hypothetical protein [Adiantum nelumboides]
MKVAMAELLCPYKESIQSVEESKGAKSGGDDVVEEMEVDKKFYVHDRDTELLYHLRENAGYIMKEKDVSPKMLVEVFKVPHNPLHKMKKVMDVVMRSEFGQPEGSRAYYMVRNCGKLHSIHLFLYLDKVPLTPPPPSFVKSQDVDRGEINNPCSHVNQAATQSPDSNISTEASVNQKINIPLETIVEDIYSDSSSKLFYFEMASSSTKVNFDLGPGHEGESSDKAPEHQLLFLKFQFVNELGTIIYKDGMERYCVKVEDRRGDMRDMVPVVYSGDRYFDDQGFMYVVVLNLSIVDKWGMTGTKEKVDVEPEEASPALNKPNLKLQKVNGMTRVNTNNIFLGLYKYDRGEHATYYRCEEIDLAELGEEPKPTYIATDLTKEEEKLLIATLKQYKDMFAWSYQDLKGVDPSICQHTIPLKSDAKPSRQHPYTYNETFARKIKEEIDKLKEAEFIYEIEHTDWVSPIVMVPNKNKKLRVCINLKKVNAATIRDNTPLPITDHMIERIAGREAYSFLNGFLVYNQLAIKPENQHKTAFATEWGIFAYRVMPFGLINAPTTFQRLMRRQSGCRLKKYHLPLTTEMLTKIHSVKERKSKVEETKAHAQKEARIKVLKYKQNLQQQKQPPIEETPPIPLATIQSNEQWQIGIDVRINVRLPDGRYQRALINTGARVNVVNHTTYKKLSDQPVMQRTRNIAMANKEIMPAMDFINLNINIDGDLCPHQFLIVEDDGISEPMCLGVSWMRTYNAILEWSENASLYA